MSNTEKAYQIARERYAEIGVDTELAMQRLENIAISMHCWQGDDVGGFEHTGAELSGGIQVTGAYPGRATSPTQLREDLQKALTLIPGKQKVSLHAIYLESDKPVARDEIAPEHFTTWANWAVEQGIGLDFNPTLFGHPLSADGFTLSSADEAKRAFWIRHCIAARKIGEYLGQKTGQVCVNNLWIADGFKDTPVDRYGYRMRLKASLDEIYTEKIDRAFNLDAVESKLFGIGSESCVIGSHEFYLAYALLNKILITLDAGHFHPTEQISDKISSVLAYADELFLHVSRPVRWDSDHVVVLNDELSQIANEIILNGFENRVHIGLDFFDGSINRIAAWVIGTRNMSKALLNALLMPAQTLKEAEHSGDYTKRLAMLEELKSYPSGAVWDYYCMSNNVPVGLKWLDEVKEYEKSVLINR